MNSFVPAAPSQQIFKKPFVPEVMQNSVQKWRLPFKEADKSQLCIELLIDGCALDNECYHRAIKQLCHAEKLFECSPH
jgi:hypothetical protein